jgi:N4-gp56 family major capsid protein
VPTTAITGTAEVASDTAAYEQLAYYQLRQEMYFGMVADVMPTDQTHPGTSVVFNLLSELAVEATPTALTELSDITPVALGDATVSVTLAEHGKGTNVSAKLRGTSYLNEMTRAATEIGYHAGKSFDNLARNPLLAGTGVFFPASFGGTGTSRATVAGTDVLTADAIRLARTELLNNSAIRYGDGYYRAFIAPDVSYDLTSETGADAWREPRVQAGARVEDVWRGTMGVFEGFNFIETPRLDIPELPTGWLNGGASNEDVYPTLFCAKQCEAKVWSSSLAENGPTPQIVTAPITDNLRRFKGVGWYWLGGFGRFREQALVRIESASSLGV